MEQCSGLGRVDNSNELWLKVQYDRILGAEEAGYCLVALSLKYFDEYTRGMSPEEREEAVYGCYTMLSGVLAEDEYIVRIHSTHFNLIIRCPGNESSLHGRAPHFHYAVRDSMQTRYGKPLYIAMGFYPMVSSEVDYYEACYFADLCRHAPHYRYLESNYDMYGVSYYDQKELFSKVQMLVEDALKNGDFKLYLQPKVDLQTGKVCSAEALVRWIDPVRGMIPLSSFLPNLEENGLIRDLDLYLFDCACGYLDRWIHEYGRRIQISFNLSRAYFNGPYFMPDYTAAFERHHVPPELIRIELLESVVLNELDRLQPLVESIYAYGFSCALDDFGSGFSSYDVLINTSLSELKIDRSLFRDPLNVKERTLIKHIVDIAHNMDMVTVAEGIEEAAYAAYLREIGCDYVQGYYYYRPMPVEEFELRFIKNQEEAVL